MRFSSLMIQNFHCGVSNCGLSAVLNLEYLQSSRSSVFEFSICIVRSLKKKKYLCGIKSVFRFRIYNLCLCHFVSLKRIVFTSEVFILAVFCNEWLFEKTLK